MAMAGPVTIAAFGDSLTYGYGLPAEDGFVPQLQEWLRGQGADVTLINAGVSGDTTSGGVARVGWVLGDGVDAVILELGANDMLRGIAPEQARANLDTILAQITARDLPVLLVGMLAPPNYGAKYQTDFDAIFPELADKYDTLYYRFFMRGLESTGKTRGEILELYMQADRLHPNAQGVKLIVAAIGPSVLELIAQIQP